MQPASRTVSHVLPFASCKCGKDCLEQSQYAKLLTHVGWATPGPHSAGSVTLRYAHPQAGPPRTCVHITLSLSKTQPFYLFPEKILKGGPHPPTHSRQTGGW